MTQHDLILAHLKLLYARCENDGWIRPMFLRGLKVAEGFIGDAVDVRLRELRREGKVESRKAGKFEEFRIAGDTLSDQDIRRSVEAAWNSPPAEIEVPTGQLFVPTVKPKPQKWWERRVG